MRECLEAEGEHSDCFDAGHDGQLRGRCLARSESAGDVANIHASSEPIQIANGRQPVRMMINQRILIRSWLLMNNKRGRSSILIAAVCIIFCIVAGFIAMRNRQEELRVPIPAVQEHIQPATNATPAFVPRGASATMVSTSGSMQFPAVLASTRAAAAATNASVTTVVNATASTAGTGGLHW
jgi:hypothetical protein